MSTKAVVGGARPYGFPRILAGVALWAIIMLSAPTLAVEGFMRCGNHLISGEDIEGPTKAEVLEKCGEPTSREGDMWVYEEPGKPTRVLHFDGGRLERIEG